MLQESEVEPGMLTVEEVIELYAGYYPDPLPLDEMIDVVGLTEQPIGAGRRSRVGSGVVSTSRSG